MKIIGAYRIFYMKTLDLNNRHRGKEKFRQSLKKDLCEALQEVKDIEAGKASALTMDDLYKELKKE